MVTLEVEELVAAFQYYSNQGKEAAERKDWVRADQCLQKCQAILGELKLLSEADAMVTEFLRQRRGF